MIQAAAGGIIDFGKGDPRDRQWTLRLRLILDAIEGRNLLKAHEVKHARYLAMASRSDLTDESQSAILDAVDAQYRKILKQLFPWGSFDAEGQRQSVIDRLSEQWRREYGDQDDPATQERIAATRATLARIAEMGARKNARKPR